MPNVKVILNPCAGRGYASKVSPDIRRYLTQFGVDFDLALTEGPGHAALLAQQALADGFDTLVAVGGDGTSHEVVNGMMTSTNGAPVGTLACIPTGSGNDFAAMNGVPEGIEDACRLIARGGKRVVDVGHVTIDGGTGQYFSNAVGIGFDGLVVKETQSFRWLRGLALYIPAVLKTVFVSLQPMRAQIRIDGAELNQTTMMMVISNGPREGHTFLVAPHALCDDGYLDLILAGTMPRLEMLAMIPRFMKGTHLNHRLVKEHKAQHILITSPDPLFVHGDGEILAEAAHRVEAQVIPASLCMIGRPENTRDGTCERQAAQAAGSAVPDHTIAG